MTAEELKQYQQDQRAKCVQAILDSPAKKKLIVAGAGTGKTYTFGRLIERRKGGNNLAMTFIRKLVTDMDTALKGSPEVKTNCDEHNKDSRRIQIPTVTFSVAVLRKQLRKEIRILLLRLSIPKNQDARTRSAVARCGSALPKPASLA